MNTDEIKEIMDKAELLIEHEQFSEAADLLKSICGYAKVSGVLEKLGEISFRQGKYPEARSLFVESLERGISEQGIVYLSLIDFKEGKFDETLKWLKYAAASSSDPSRILDLSSSLCMRMLDMIDSGVNFEKELMRGFSQFLPDVPLLVGKCPDDLRELLSVRFEEIRRRWIAFNSLLQYKSAVDPSVKKYFIEQVIKHKKNDWGQKIKETSLGQLHPEIYSMFYHLAYSMPHDFDILDIGCGMGGCAISFAKGLQDSQKKSKVIAVDDCVTSPGGQYKDQGREWIISTVNKHFESYGAVDKIKLWPHPLNSDTVKDLKDLLGERKLAVIFIDASGDLSNELAPFYDMIIPGGFVIVDDYGEENTMDNIKMTDTKIAVDEYIESGKLVPLGRFGWLACTIFCYKPFDKGREHDS